VIALSGIVTDQSIRIAGDEFNDDILNYMRKQHNMLIGERSAERIKIEVGAALPELDNPPQDIEIRGKDLMTGIPKTISISYKEVAHALNKSIIKIEESVLKALESTPPELSADIYERGIHLTGGGALLRGLDIRLKEKTKLPIHVAEDPLKAVVRGTGIVLKNLDEYRYLLD
jgi:rod shape-determining protein MreB